MPDCPTCLKTFVSLDQHLKRKTPCKAPTNTIVEPPKPFLNNKAVSLFSGCGGDTLGLERADFKVQAFSELKKVIASSHLENFPESKLITDVKGTSSDITKIEDSQFAPYTGTTDVLFAGFPCFPKDTLVLTNSGYKPIQHVELTDTLLTHTGKFQRIVNLQQKEYNDTVYDISLKYKPTSISATSEHPFYVRPKIETWDNTNRRYITTFGPPVWKRASDLTTKDYFGMVINSNSIVPEFKIQKILNSNRTDTVAFRLDKNDHWFTLGYFVGDGWIEDTTKASGRCNNKIRFAINNKDEPYVLSRITPILPITDKKCSTGAAKKFGCADKTWYTIFAMFGKYAHGKRIPEWVQDAPKPMIQEFINGYMAADGNIRKDGKHRITTVSVNLALGLQRLYLKLGHIFSISKTIRAPTHVIEGRTVNQRSTYVVEGLLNLKRKVSSFIEGNYVWISCPSINQRQVSNTPVYNFEVEHDNSYIVENTIVHNCQGFSLAGKKQVGDPRNQLYLQFVRATKIIKPLFIIGENVQGLQSMKSGPNQTDPLVIENIAAAFETIGYSISYKIHEAVNYGVPQKRKRMLIIGWDNSRVKKFSPTKFWQAVEANGKNNPTIAIRSFVSNSMEGAYQIPPAAVPHDFAQYALPVPQDAQPSGTPHPYVVLKTNANLLSCYKRISPIHSEIIDVDAPAKTIICTYAHGPRLLLGLRKPDGTAYVRTLLPDELKQIQGFPSTYKLLGSTSEKIIQIGNAVPPPMIEAVAKAIRSSIALLP